MGGKSKKVTVGYKYSIGAHLGLIHGPADKLLRIRVDKRTAWTGLSAGGQITIDNEELFGGEKREGGISGNIDVEMGDTDQGQNDYLQSKIETNIPAFRGIVAVVLRGLYVGLNPYLKPFGFRLQRILKAQDGDDQWYLSKAAIENANITYETGVLPFESDTADDITQYEPFDDPEYEQDPPRFVPITYQGRSYFRSNNENDGPNTSSNLVYPTTSTESPNAFRVVFKLPELAAGSTAGNANQSMQFSLSSGTVTLRPRIYWDSPDIYATQIVGFGPNFNIVPAIVTEVNVIYDWVFILGESGRTSRLYNYETGELISEDTDGSVLNVGTVDNFNLQYSIFTGTPTAFATDLHYWAFGEYDEGTHNDMNPAHIIYECLTNQDWGMGYSSTDIDETSFQDAADTLYDESFGLSLIWDREKEIGKFIDDIKRHIDAELYISRTTGKFVLKLIRNDYTESSLTVLGEDDIDYIENYNKRTFGELVNSVTVVYQDASLQDEEEAITVQDISLVQQQGSVLTATQNYPGIANSTIAIRVAERDLKSFSSQLINCTIYCNRVGASLNPGDAFFLNWPDLEINNLVMRVQDISLGDGKVNRVRITATQDIFDTPSNAIIDYQGGNATNPGEGGDAVNMSNRLFIEAPYYELVQEQSQTAIDELLVDNPLLGYCLAAGGRPSSGTSINADLYIDNGSGFEDVAVIDFCPYGELMHSIGFTDTTITIEANEDIDQLNTNTVAQLNNELIVINSITESSGGYDLGIGRGVLDTLPEEHSAGSKLFCWDEFGESDGVEYDSGESISAKMLTNSGTDKVSISSASQEDLTFGQRAARPYPPANVKIDNQYYPSIIYQSSNPITISWAHRDRTQQTSSTIYDFTSGDIGPESGVTYNLRIYFESTEVVNETGLTGTSFNFDPEINSVETYGAWSIELETVRDGLTSFQIFTHDFEIGLDSNYST